MVSHIQNPSLLGAISCQIMHMIYPGRRGLLSTRIDSIPMNKVNFLAIDQFECQKNYRLLQTAFTKKKIPFVPFPIVSSSVELGYRETKQRSSSR